MTAPPDTRYARSDGVSIAYQVVGDGPVDMVLVPGWITHLEYQWEEPGYARWFERLASFTRLILLDKRGTGLSDRVPVSELPTLEERMDDLRAVMDTVGSKRAVLFGGFEGGPLCALFAATYPERTRALILYGAYARGTWASDYPWAPTPSQIEDRIHRIETDWGGPEGLEERAPSVARDLRFRRWYGQLLRLGASPSAAMAIVRMNAGVDVRQILPAIRVPTLVLHRAGGKIVTTEENRYIASQIPGARYVQISGEDHMPFVGDQEPILTEVEEFITGARRAHDSDRILATVLFTDIVASTEHLARLGDRSWGDLLAAHRNVVRRALARHRGEEIDTAGDGFLAMFDGPGRAIRCAHEIVTAVRGLGIEVRAGLHTGECERLSGGLAGLAVHIAARVLAAAGPGDVLVSSTVRDLVAGSAFAFDDRGRRELKGIPGRWQLYAVDSAMRVPTV